MWGDTLFTATLGRGPERAQLLKVVLNLPGICSLYSGQVLGVSGSYDFLTLYPSVVSFLIPPHSHLCFPLAKHS